MENSEDADSQRSSDSNDVPFLSPQLIRDFSRSVKETDSTSDLLRKRPRQELVDEDEKSILKCELDTLFAADPAAPPPTVCSYLLRHYFNISSGCFRPRQSEVCLSVLQGKNTLAVCPTGWGKSMCYLFPMLVHRLLYEEDVRQWKSGADTRSERGSLEMEEGIYSRFCLVVSPLVSLMTDQSLKVLDIESLSCVVLSSQCGKVREGSILANLANPHSTIDIVFLSPEKLIGCHELRNIISSQPKRLAFMCIDEVHCVSKWAFNFRPSYLCLNRIMEWSSCVDSASPVRFLCLTATASSNAIADLKESFSISTTVECTDLFRHNLQLDSIDLSNSGVGPPTTKVLLDTVIQSVTEMPKPLIVYVRTRVDADEFASVLNAKVEKAEVAKGCDGTANATSTVFRRCQRVGDAKNTNNLVVRSYHAALPRSQRSKVQREFLNDEIDVLVATVAFGMGIDKPNIRGILHAQAPSSLENYVQEIGRAGRDGVSSRCRVLYNPYDYYTLRSSILSSYISLEEVTSIMHEMLQHPVANVGERVILIPVEKISFAFEICEEVVETILYMMVLKFPNIFRQIKGICSMAYKIGSRQTTIDGQGEHRSKFRGEVTTKARSAAPNVANTLFQASLNDQVLTVCKRNSFIGNAVTIANQLRMSLEELQCRLNFLSSTDAVQLKGTVPAYAVVLQGSTEITSYDEKEMAKAVFDDHESHIELQRKGLSLLFSVLKNPSHEGIDRIMRGERGGQEDWKPPLRSLSKMDAVSIVNEFVEQNRMRLRSPCDAARALLGVMPKSVIKRGKFAGQIPLAHSWYVQSPYFGVLREFEFSWVLTVVSAAGWPSA